MSPGCSKRSGPITWGLTGLLLVAPAAQAQRYVPSDDPAFPRIQYEDSLVSLNDRCIVRLMKLTRKLPPIYVNGLPIGFC
ncbi:MAG: hypothetical protein ACE5G2_03875 [Candidatus Krumholzibacteriia bacterium]